MRSTAAGLGIDVVTGPAWGAGQGAPQPWSLPWAATVHLAARRPG
jgi:hypothetical protein